ncbi:hypothetical protein B0H15DRAFT_825052 [Mycena belliarum]|uniref:Yeast cell wall synthesis Kre9/Knh1-like N-terminal domain-containing protein n=1 Tax=Mycena belliarum TaxID=1033014 RepID=A0AAD6XSW1_9AGAR|nr:hypothetical protein B0H15DRAFT_825052 [Mycena belliae]
MMFPSAFSSILVLMSAASLALGMPLVALQTRDVFVPPVLEPTAGTVWVVGQPELVSWDTSSAPVNITNKVGRIMLRKGGLTTSVTLADNFDILIGQITVTVPSVEDGDDYEVVLFGDSGNFSPPFTITGA